QVVDIRAGGLAGDPAAGAVSRGRAPVEGGGEFPPHVWTAEAHGREPGAVHPGGVRGELGQVLHVESSLAQFLGAAAVQGVTGGVTHGSHAGVLECTRTGGGEAGVAARFKSDDGGAAPCAVARILQGGYFGMRASGPLVPALADGAAVGIENDAAHGGGGAAPAVPARAPGAGAAHRGRERAAWLR